nr:MAG TPA: Transcriptional regulator PadR-like family [Caudoviricetes sp.]
MQFTINIDQRSVVENGWGLSFDDMAIFDFMSKFILGGALLKQSTPKGDFYWVSFSKIREELPMLSGNSDSSIKRHIANLIRVGLIEKCDEEISIRRHLSLYRLGEAYHKYWRRDTPPNLDGNPSKNERVTPSNLDDTPPNLDGNPSKNERVTPSKMNGNHNTSILYNQNHISPNGGLSASALDSKEEKNENPKTKPKKEPTIITKARNIFEPYFEKKTGEKYYWKVVDAVQMKRLINQLKFSRASRDLPTTDDDLLSALQVFLDKINDNWMLANLSVSNISSKYNELVAQARKQKGQIGIVLRNNTDDKYLNQKIKQWK